ncbi:MAG: thiol reductant ABC exporter subunit CydC [Acidobacteria bacterium]|nr:thiol reductant ABC exporter subunit CydC [Acidobacteriota bacterium]
MSPLRRLVGLVLPHWRGVLLATALGAATVLSSVGLMAASAFIIAAAALHPSIAELEVAIVGVRFFGISRGVFRYGERLVSHDLTFRILARLRVWFYTAIEPLAPARLGGARSGDLLARAISDVEALEELFVRAFAPPLVALGVAAVTAGFLSRYHPELAAAYLAFFALGGVAAPLVMRRLSRGVGPRQRALAAEIHQAVVESVQGLPDLLACGAEGAAVERVAVLGNELAAAQTRMGRIDALDAASGTLVANLGTWCLLVLAVPMVRAARFDGVSLAVLTLAALASFEAVQTLPAAAQYLEGQLAAARRLLEIADADPAVTDPAEPLPLSEVSDASPVRISGLCFAYPGSPAPALDGIDLELRAGGSLALVGPSGAGKSTLAALLLRFWEGWEGRIELWGHDIRRYRQEDVRRALGMVSQSTHLFAASVRDNLLLARPDASDAELWAALERGRLAAFVAGLQDGLDTWIGEQGLQLSGGQRQRLALARALLAGPPLLLLDEPTANLDAVTEREVLSAIHEATAGRSTLTITHRLVAMERFDEIVVLDRGRIVARGRHHELLEAGGLYARLWSLQHGQLLEEPLPPAHPGGEEVRK